MRKKISNYPSIHTIRYMGNKTKLFDFIIPQIEKITNEGDIICDLMCGTSSIGYALSQRNQIISNDFQKSSSIVSEALLLTKSIPTLKSIHDDIDVFYFDNIKNKNFSFFYSEYPDTYFAKNQCLQIDSLRYAIDKSPKERQSLYLTILMSAMCKAQSTPGHFAQFFKKNNKRIQSLREYDLLKIFYEKAAEFQTILTSKYKNSVFNMDYNELFKYVDLKNVKCFYLDPPYTSDQYSRFYHILETVCLYDYPKTSYKAKYRDGRKMSKFCYKTTVYKEFEKIISFAHTNNSSLVISYSNHGIAEPEKILEIGKKYYNHSSLTFENYNHSSQGNGSIKISECLIIFKY